MGAPQSGKSKLAEGLVEALKPKETYVVDNYVEEASKEAAVAIFPLSPYIANLLVAMKRFAKENRYSNTQDHIISVGTVLETQLYEAIEGSDSERFKPYEDEHQLRVESSLHTLGCIYLDTFVYDAIFVSAYEGETEDWAVMQDQIKKLLEQYKIDYTLLEGDLESRVKAAMNVLRQTEKKRETKNAQRSGVPGSGAQGEADGDTPESVSDVPEQTGSN